MGRQVLPRRPCPADTGSGAGARARFTNRSGPRSPQKRSRRAGRPGFCSPRWLRSCVDVRELRSRRPPSKPVWRRRGRAGGDSAQRRRGSLPHGPQTARGTLLQVHLRTIKSGSLQPFCTTLGSLRLAATPQHFTHRGKRMVVASRWAVLTVSDGGIRLILELHRPQTRKTPPARSRTRAARQGLRLCAGGAMRDAGYRLPRAPFPHDGEWGQENGPRLLLL